MPREFDSRPSAEHIQTIKDKFGDELSKTPNFSGLGIGHVETEAGQKKLVLVVNVTSALTEKQRETVPSELEGIGIDYRIVGQVKTLT